MNLGLRDPYDESVSPKKERGKKHPLTTLILFALNSLGASPGNDNHYRAGAQVARHHRLAFIYHEQVTWRPRVHCAVSAPVQMCLSEEPR